ncbi:MAG: GAF domain-containing protein, partial [Acidobacteriota bacterium]
MSKSRNTASHLRRNPGGDSFKRLVQTGLRLNALRSAQELHHFLIEEVTRLSGAERVLLLLETCGGLHTAGALVPAGEDAGTLLQAITPWLDEAGRTHAARLRHGPEEARPADQRSCFVAPLLARKRLLGFLYADIEGASGRFCDTDRKLLAMLSAQAAAALDNLQWAQDLERKAEERYDVAMRAINEGVYDWNLAEGTIYYSERVRAATGMTPGSIRTPEDWRARIHPDDLPAYDTAIVDHLKRRAERFECDYRFRALDDTWRWARQHGIAIRNERGRAIRMIGSTGDITELKRAEEALKQSEERYALATRAAAEGIYDWNVETGELYLSDKAREFWGFAPGTLKNQDWAALIHPQDYPAYRQAVIDHFHGCTVLLEHEMRARDAHGEYCWVHDRGIAVRDKNGRAIRLVGATSDITQRKLAEQVLRQAHNETKEALERQTATAEVLRVIGSSMTDTQPVFDAIVQNVRRLFGTRFAVLQLLRGDMIEMAALDGDPGFEKLRERYPRPLDETTVGGRAMLTRQAFQLAPVLDNPATPPATVQFACDFGFNSVIFSPMIHEGKVIGAIGAAHPGAKPFDERQLALIKTFADQAVIAIQNVRLFNETKEALERQTATAEILNVIASSPSDVQPVFDAIAKSAYRLIGGFSTAVARVFDDALQLVAFSSTDEAGNEALKHAFPMPVSRSKAARTATPVSISDTEALPDSASRMRELARTRGFRGILIVPLLRNGVATGTISVTRREPGEFSNHQVDLLKTFADQAVIAIENVRLFNETREALDQQRASSEVLGAISSSIANTSPVFEAILAACERLFEGHLVGLNLVDDASAVYLAAYHGPREQEMRAIYPLRLDRSTGSGLCILEGRPIQFPDVNAPDG